MGTWRDRLPWRLGKARTAERERKDLLKRVSALEHSAELVNAPERARLWNEIGSVAVEVQEDADALRSFGRAIDAYLEAGYFEAAAAMCRKLLRLYPSAVRVRCTLACLAIGHRDLGDAAQEIVEYVLATKRTGTQRFAVPRLRLMASVAQSSGVLQCIAAALGELGDADGREAVLQRMAVVDPDEADAADRWERLLEVARMNREQLQHLPILNLSAGPGSIKAGEAA